MNIQDLLTSEPGLTLIGAVLGGLWAFFKSTKLFGRFRRRRFRRALEILEAAAEDTYRVYVRAIKRAREDGKLTDEEIRKARRYAKQRALEIARRQGLNLTRILGAEFLDLWLSKAVTGLKIPASANSGPFSD